jgi:DNA invertase Pin-like site-specific DNA recombinase
LQTAKLHGATLIIAKLDRLSRNVAFVTQLMDSGIDFVCCDAPHADRFTIHLLASYAQYESDLISQNTKAALQAKKARGEKWVKGHKFDANDRAKAVNAIKAKAANNENTKKAKALAIALHKAGKSYTEILKALQKAGFKTPRGKAFTQITQVKPLLQ